MNQIKAGATLSYIVIFLNNIVRLAYTPFLIRALGQSEYGLYSLAAATVGYLSVMDLGFGNAIVRYTAKYKVLKEVETENKLHGMFIVIYTIIGLIVAFLGAILYFYSSTLFGDTMSALELGKIKILIVILTFNLAITFPFSIFNSVIIANEKFIFSKSLNIIMVLLNPLIMIPLLLIGYKSIALVLVMTFLNILTLVFNFIYCKKKIGISPTFGSFDKSLLKEIVGYSFYVFLAAIVDQIYWNTGQFILGAVSGTVMVSIYAVAITLKNLYFSMSTSIVGVLLPKVTKMITDKVSNDELSALFIKVGRLQFIILSFVLTCFIVFGEKFVELWAGIGYSESYVIALCIMIPVTIPLIQNLGITILQAKNQQKFRSVTYVIIAIINVLVSIPMAKKYGGLGCAIVTGSSLILGNIIIMNIYYSTKIKLNILLFWKEIIKLAIPVFLSVTLFKLIEYIINTDYSFIFLVIKVITYTFIFGSIMWRFGMNEYEKGIVYQNFMKIKNKFI